MKELSDNSKKRINQMLGRLTFIQPYLEFSIPVGSLPLNLNVIFQASKKESQIGLSNLLYSCLPCLILLLILFTNLTNYGKLVNFCFNF
jgi:hypothetical protein